MHVQNEFATPGGKLHDAVKDVMERWVQDGPMMV